MDLATKVSSTKESGMDKEAGNQQKLMEIFILALTILTKRMATVVMFGQMAACTKEAFLTTSSKHSILYRHGKGRLTYQDGKEIKGVWEEGNLMSTESDKKIV